MVEPDVEVAAARLALVDTVHSVQPMVPCDSCGRSTPLRDSVGAVGQRVLHCSWCGALLIDQVRGRSSGPVVPPKTER